MLFVVVRVLGSNWRTGSALEDTKVPLTSSRAAPDVRALLVTSRTGEVRLALAPESTWIRLPGPDTVEPVICTTGDALLELVVPLNVFRVCPAARVIDVPEICVSGTSAAVETSGVTGAVVTAAVVEDNVGFVTSSKVEDEVVDEINAV